MTVPLVASIIIPTYNEARDIAGCVDQVGGQDVGCEELEVILVDGGSDDRTVTVAREAAARYPFARFKVLDNPERRTAAGLHRALQEVRAPCVVRVDARSRIGPGHVGTAVKRLEERSDVGVVGGSQVPIMPSSGVVARGIARALSNRYATGLGRYRRGGASGPTDTVWMGAFRTGELRSLGGWDPAHGINEDYELNTRYRTAGYLVWFDESMPAGYVPRSDLAALARQYYAFGKAKGSQWGSGVRPAPRHLVLMAVPPSTAWAMALLTRRVGVPTTVALAMSGLVALDVLGARGSSAPPSVRVTALLATVTFQGAWWFGAVGSLVRPRLPWRRRGESQRRLARGS